MREYILLVAVLISFGASALAKEGYYVEFKMSGKMFSGATKTYSADGNTRTELYMKSPAMPDPIATTSITLGSNLHMAYMISEKDKTYSEVEGGKGNKPYDDDIEVTVIGKERVNNYNSTHVKIRFKKGQHETEMWLSKDIAGYASYTVIKNDYLGGSKFFEQLKAKGADGFVVRMLVGSGREGETMQMDLVKAEKRNIDAALFSLSGYTKTASGGMPGFGGKSMEEIKKMTAEERQKYIQEIQQKYQQKH